MFRMRYEAICKRVLYSRVLSRPLQSVRDWTDMAVQEIQVLHSG